MNYLFFSTYLSLIGSKENILIRGSDGIVFQSSAWSDLVFVFFPATDERK